jgi:hypothetical protein
MPDATPSPALIKAVFTAVAKDLHGFNNADGAVMGHRPDRFQGYGRIDLDAVVNSQDPVFSIDQSVLSRHHRSKLGQDRALPPILHARCASCWRGPMQKGTAWAAARRPGSMISICRS